MSGISVSRDEALISIDTRFYGYLAAVVAASEFTEHFWIQMDGDPDKVLTVRLVPKNDELDLKAGAREFFNYMLALIQESRSLIEGEIPGVE